LDDQLKLAFQFASELTKQLITLATGILALSVTFTKDILKSVPARGRYALFISWILFLLSIIAGIITLAALTGSLAPLRGPSRGLGSNVRIPSGIQIITFVLGTILLALYGYLALSAPPANTSSSRPE